EPGRAEHRVVPFRHRLAFVLPELPDQRDGQRQRRYRHQQDQTGPDPGYTPQVFFNQIYKIGHYTIHNTPLTLSYSHDTLNRFFKPTRGGLQQVSAEIGLPGGTVPYYKLTLSSSDYFPLPFDFVGHVSGTLGYGKAYSKDISVQYADADGVIRTMSFPFFQNYYAGGVRDVRGFQDNTLGPRICSGLIDANGKPDPTAIATSGNNCIGGSYYRPQ